MQQHDPLDPAEREPVKRAFPTSAWLGIALMLLAIPIALLVLREKSPGTAAKTAAVAQTADAAVPVTKKRERISGDRKLSGLILDDQKKPLANALIRASSLDDADALPWETNSDANGRFAFADLARHALTLEVTREGHDGAEHTLRADDEEEMTLVLPRQGELMVLLRDAPGVPVVDTVVTLTGPGLWPAAEVKANAAGEALFGKLAFGEYRARARRAGRVALPSSKVRVVPGERAQVNLLMTEGAALSIKVLDRTTHAPIADAKLAAFDATPGISPLLAQTDAQGAINLQGLLPGALRLEITHAGHAPKSVDATLPSESVIVELDGEASIAGRVVDEAGRPIEGALLSVATREGLPVQLSSKASPVASVGELGVTHGPVPKIPITFSAELALGTLATQSDVQGLFRIAGLAPTPVTLSAARSGFASNSVNLDDLTPHSEKRDVQIVLRAAGRIDGTILDLRGHPAASVYVSARSTQGAEHSAISDAAGRFALLDVLGEVTVTAEPHGYTPLTCHVTVTAGAHERCDMTVGSTLYELPVRVMDEFRFGLEGVLIAVTGATQRTHTQVTHRDGSVVLRDLPEPPYHVEASLRGFVTASLDVQEAERELRISLARAASLAGHVTDTLGRAVPRAIVSTADGEATAETDDEGAFVLNNVAPGPLYVLAAHKSVGEGRSEEVRARAGETLETLRIVLPGRYLANADDAEASSTRTRVAPTAASVRPERRSKPGDFDLELRGSDIVFSAIAPGGNADRAGIRAGDALVAIDGESVLSAAQGRGMLRAPPGLAANLRLARNGNQLRVRYKRPAL